MLAFVQHGEAKFTSSGAVDTSAGQAVLARWSAPAAVDEAFDALRSSWDRLLGGFQVTCPDEHLGRMVNAWNQYQCMATFNLSRSASLFETGIGRGMGFRDSNQDLLGFVHMIPGRARQRLLDLAATQLSDGTCFHQYQPLTQARERRRRWRLLRRPSVARPVGVRVHQGDGRRVGARRTVRLRRPDVRERRRAREPAAPPRDLARLHHGEAGPARPAAHRARRLERLPQPQLLLDRTQRVVPDGGRRRRARRPSR